MKFDDKHLTPKAKYEAGPTNYTWHDGKGPYPIRAGYVFLDKKTMAEQVNKDYPSGKDCVIKGTPETLGQNTVIGGPGFGWYGSPPKRFPHIGDVRIGIQVEIGSNVTIDRGALGDTAIRDHVKIDNGVHIGHNALIGRAAILTAHCVIGGSAVVGEDAWIGLGAIIKNQVRVGARAVVGMGAIVVKDVEPDTTVIGNPARQLIPGNSEMLEL